MFVSIHSKFINEPLLNILVEGITASHCLGNKIEVLPLIDYLMQSVFLKMTGAQEQKLKCICWDMATNDFKYRRDYLSNNYGECSSYKDKNHVFNDILKQIDKVDKIDIFKLSVKTEIVNKSINQITSIFDNTNIAMLDFFNYSFFKNNTEQIFVPEQFCINNKNDFKLFESKIQKKYETIVYNHRNRCAHNLDLYKQLQSDICIPYNSESVLQNYYIRFSLITIIDDIFIKLYKIYQHLFD